MTALLEILKISPSGTARIDHRGDAVAKGESIGIDAVVAGVGAFLSCSSVGVHVDIDKAGREIEPVQGDGLDRVRRCNVRCNINDLAILDGDVHDAIAMILWVENVAAGEHKVIFVLAHRE